jgi:hypothetical protein
LDSRAIVIYVDESIQESLGYIATAIAYCEVNPAPLVASALLRAGLNPNVDEYKSGVRMQSAPALRMLRDEIVAIARDHARIAVLFTPNSERGRLGEYLLEALAEMLSANSLPISQHCFIDEGIALPDSEARRQLQLGGMTIWPDSDSRHVLGLQLADCAAYHASYVLKAELQGSDKQVRLGAEDGYEDSVDAELGWVFRTQFRYAYLTDTRLKPDCDVELEPSMRGYGSFIRGVLPEAVSSAIGKCFGRLWLGCVH